MSQTARKDANGVFSITAMLGGRRKSSRIAAQASKTGSQKVGFIKDSIAQHSTKNEVQAKKGRPTKSPRAADNPPKAPGTRRRRQRAAPSAQNEIQAKPNRRTGQGTEPVRHSRGAPDLSQSKPRPRKKTLKEVPLSEASRPLTEDIGTQTDPFSLSRGALRRLELEVSGLDTSRPTGTQGAIEENNMGRTKSVTTARSSVANATVYDEDFLVELEENDILEQQLTEYASSEQDEPEFAPKVPKNYGNIREAIQRDRPKSDDPSPQEYKDYMEQVYEPQSEDTVKDTLFRLFFGIPGRIEPGHKVDTRRWVRQVAITTEFASKPFVKKPHVDRTEGLKRTSIDPEVRAALGGVAVPTKTLGFPNFMVEFKRDRSMFVAHGQNRHSGAVASQAYHEYYDKCLGKAELSWDVAKVGSVEFNGDVVVGNVHWVSKASDADSDDDSRKYHMTRAFNHFAFGLNFDDFKLARREARNFRDHFFNERDVLLQTFGKAIKERRASIRQTRNNAKRVGPSPAVVIPTGEEVENEEEDEDGEDTSGNDHQHQSRGCTVEDTEDSWSQGTTPRQSTRKRRNEPVASTEATTKKRKTKTRSQPKRGSTNLTQGTERVQL